MALNALITPSKIDPFPIFMFSTLCSTRLESSMELVRESFVEGGEKNRSFFFALYLLDISLTLSLI